MSCVVLLSIASSPLFAALRAAQLQLVASNSDMNPELFNGVYESFKQEDRRMECGRSGENISNSSSRSSLGGGGGSSSSSGSSSYSIKLVVRIGVVVVVEVVVVVVVVVAVVVVVVIQFSSCSFPC